MTVKLIHFVSSDGSYYDFFAIAPTDMAHEDAVTLANAVICQKNHEDHNNESDGCCDDGLSVQASIKAALAEFGFGVQEDLIECQQTVDWDLNHGFKESDQAVIDAFKARRVINTSVLGTKKLAP